MSNWFDWEFTVWVYKNSVWFIFFLSTKNHVLGKLGQGIWKLAYVDCESPPKNPEIESRIIYLKTLKWDVFYQPRWILSKEAHRPVIFININPTWKTGAPTKRFMKNKIFSCIEQMWISAILKKSTMATK